MVELSGDELLRLKATLRNLDPGPYDVVVPVPKSFEIPQTLEDYRILSRIVIIAWNFGVCIDLWFRNHHEWMTTNQLHSAIRGLAKSCELLQTSRYRRDFDAFNRVAVESPSVHVQLSLEAEARHRALKCVYSNALNFTTWSNLSLNQFVEVCRLSDDEPWQEAKIGYSMQLERISSEFARLADNFESKQANERKWTLYIDTARMQRLLGVAAGTSWQRFVQKHRNNIEFDINQFGKENRTKVRLRLAFIQERYPNFPDELK